MSLHPDPLFSREVKSRYVDQLKSSLNYLLDFWSNETGKSLHPNTTSFLEQFDEGDERLWYLSSLNRRLVDLAIASRLRPARLYLDDFARVVRGDILMPASDDMAGLRITNDFLSRTKKRIKRGKRSSTCGLVFYNDLSSLQRAMFATYATENSGMHRQHVNFLHVEHIETTRSILENVLSLIADSLPDYFNEFETYVNSIILYDSQVMAAGTGASLCGSMFIHTFQEMNERNVFIVCDRIIHETAHLFLHYQSHEDPFVENEDSELYPSPFRDCKRPVIAIYHAHFVLARLISALQNCDFQSFFAQDLYDEALQNYRAAFQRTSEILSKYAKFTDRGKEIFNDTQGAFGKATLDQVG